MKRIATSMAAGMFAMGALAGCGAGEGDRSAGSPTSPAAQPTATQEQPTTHENTDGTPTYTMAQVAEHNSATSCWTVIDGEVYDVTDWISQHPGGPDRIKALCGTDGTSNFQGQHLDAVNPNERLASYMIGVLRN